MFGAQIGASELNKYFLIPFRPTTQNNAEKIAAELDRLIQSNEKVSLTHTLWDICVTSLKLPQGTDATYDIILYIIDGHYHLTKSFGTLFKSFYYCVECNATFKKKLDHPTKCTRLCMKCCRMNGKYSDPMYPPTKCEQCKVTFLSDSCCSEHRRSVNPRNGMTIKSICGDRYLCEECGKCVIKSRLKYGVQHKCRTSYCGKCQSYHPSRENCFIPQLSEQQSKDYRLVFFDFETTQNDEIEDGIFEHKVNCVVAQAMCTRCVAENTSISSNTPCPNCGPARQLVSTTADGGDPIEDLMNFIFKVKTIHSKVISHYGGKFDMHFVLKSLYDGRYGKPRVCARGLKLYSLKIQREKGCVEFLDSYNFLNASLANLPKSFNLNIEAKLYFPHLYNRPENYDIERGVLPETRYYSPEHMLPDVRVKFMNWYDLNVNTPFCLRRDLVVYCVNDVDILREVCLKFRDLYMGIAQIDPFLQSTTIASLGMRIFRTHFLPSNSISIMPENGYNREQLQSVIALKYLMWESNKTGLGIRHRNSTGGEYHINRDNGGYIRVDGYVQNGGNQIVYEVLGCYYHGCPKCAPTNRGKMSAHGLTIKENYQAWLKRLSFLRNRQFEVRAVWECEINTALRRNPEMKQYFDECEVVDPISVRRDAYFGGRTHPSRMYYQPSCGEEIRFFDVVSLYPSQMREQSFPVGHPKVISGDSIEANLPWTSAGDCIYRGLIKCRVVPPSNLIEPVLPYRAKTGQLMFPLCAKCTELSIKSASDTIDSCTHSDKERAWILTYCHPELQKALEKGYRVTHIFEVWQFDQFSNTLFEGYVNKFVALKVENSGFPQSVVTDQQKKDYATRYREQQGIEINLEKVNTNPGLRYIAKLSLNSLYGKFGQSNTLSEIKYAQNVQELTKLVTDPTFEVEDLTAVSDEMIRVSMHKKDDYVIESPISNVAIAAFVTCYARLRLYHFMEMVEGRVLYVDTDSVCYISRPGLPDIPEGELLGEMSREYAEYIIEEFVAAGPKQYGLKLRHRETEEQKYILKIRGFTLDHTAKELLSYDVLKDMVICKYGENRKKRVTLSYPHIKRTKYSNVYTVNLSKTYAAVYGKGTVMKNFETRPFGFRP
ncbi:unnamed protein product [Anisakis simplex]|uniref:DNA-directed DNA polymerase n=1 Tax=Anisakis simplex TaxID=6269 RepID=A0A0M3K9D7_ANISI|nr:unnamed protein product [Anisakis simplex]